MKPDVKKIREMLAYFPHAPLRYDTRSWKCFDNEGTVLFEFKPWDKSGCRFEDLAMFSLFSSAPTLLREACERIKKLEKVAETARAMRFVRETEKNDWNLCCDSSLVQDLRDALSALDIKEQP